MGFDKVCPKLSKVEDESEEIDLDSLLKKLRKKIEQLTDNYIKFKSSDNQPSLISANAEYLSEQINLSVDKELHFQLQSNEHLLKSLNNQNKKFKDLQENIQHVQEKLSRLDEHCSIVDPSKKFNSLTHISSTSASNQNILQQPFSLPTFGSAASSKMIQQSHTQLENEVLKLESEITKLKAFNIQLQVQNQNLEKKFKQLVDAEKELANKNVVLSQLLKNPDSSSIRFSAHQKPHIEEFRNRLEREAEDLKNQLDTTVNEARSNINIARKKQQEAENQLPSLQRMVDEAEQKAGASIAQVEELRTALVVATRVTPQSLSTRSQQTMENLRSMARQYEEDCRRRNIELQEAKQENFSLQEQMRQNRRGINQTIINRTPGGTTTIERNNRSVTITNEGVTIAQGSLDDIETDLF